ncbi:hypothetical protein Esti_002432 [Eimeria stiedai]
MSFRCRVLVRMGDMGPLAQMGIWLEFRSEEVELERCGAYGENRALLSKVLDNMTKASEAIAALRKNAREAVEALAKSMRGSMPTGLQAREALGGEFAQAFVRFIDLNESRVDKILRTASLVVERSNRMPAFEGYADEPLLVVTPEDITHIGGLVSQGDYVQSRIEGAIKSCAGSLGIVLRAEAVGVELEHRMPIKGVAPVFERSGELSKDREGQDSGLDVQAAEMLLTAELPELRRSITQGLPIKKPPSRNS